MESVYSIAQSHPKIVGGAVILIGAVMAFRGYRIFHSALRLYGAVLGAGVGLALQRGLWVDAPNWGPFVCMGGGAIVGIALIKPLYMAAVFTTGALGAAAVAGNAMLGATVPQWAHIAVVVAAGAIAGALSLKLERPMITLATALLGAVSVGVGLGQFGYAALPVAVTMAPDGFQPTAQFTPIGTAMFALLTLAGVFAQWGLDRKPAEPTPAAS